MHDSVLWSRRESNMIKNYNKFGANMTNCYDTYEELSEKFNIKLPEILQIDLNRSGIFLKEGEVKEDFRVRFKGQILDDYETWYALPVRNEKDTPFMVCSDGIYFYDRKLLIHYKHIRYTKIAYLLQNVFFHHILCHFSLYSAVKQCFPTNTLPHLHFPL